MKVIVFKSFESVQKEIDAVALRASLVTWSVTGSQVPQPEVVVESSRHPNQRGLMSSRISYRAVDGVSHSIQS